MESGRVSGSPSGNGEDDESSHFSYIDAFQKAWSYYLYLGMPYSEYWDGDPRLVIAYREAYEIKVRHENMLAWVQGQYVKAAIADLVPLLNPFSKKHKDLGKYPKKPYAITKKMQEEDDIAEMYEFAHKLAGWGDQVGKQIGDKADKGGE